MSGLAGTLGDLLPSAIAVALSPMPIVAVILMLATKRGRANGAAFGLGWVLGLVVVSTIVLALSSGADTSSATADTISWGKVALGVLLLALSFRRWRNLPGPGEPAEMPKWMEKMDSFTPVRALLLGAALSGLNPKNLVITAAAATTISQAGLDGTATVISVAVFVVLASVTVAGPVLAALLAPSATTGALTSLREFMSQHNSAIMMVLLLVFGAKLIGDGLGVLGG